MPRCASMNHAGWQKLLARLRRRQVLLTGPTRARRKNAVSCCPEKAHRAPPGAAATTERVCQTDGGPGEASRVGRIAAAPAAAVDGDHTDADARMGDADSREQPQRDARGSQGDGSGVTVDATQPAPPQQSARPHACTDAAGGADAGADAMVRGVQTKMAQLLPPSVADGAPPGWTTVGYSGRGRATRVFFQAAC